MKSTKSPERASSIGDRFDRIFDGADKPITTGKLQALALYPDPVAVVSGLRLLAGEVSQLFQNCNHRATLTFELLDSPDFDAWSTSVGDDYLVCINIGLYKRLDAIFRQLSLANAFGKYTQTTYFDRDSLQALLSLPDIQGLRLHEKAVSINSLLSAPSSPKLGLKQLDRYLSKPPLDAKHKFDIQTLTVPALIFAFWHELAHVLLGHRRWAEPEESNYDEHSVGLEYIADDYAARRIAYDILQSALREKGCYTLGPFWFNRSGFEAVGKLEGMPGADIQFNLEGFIYRIAFALEVLVYHFRGFFSEPVAHRKKPHPHPETRLVRIIDVVKRHLLTAPFDPRDQRYLAQIWDTMCGYAMFTAEKALAACESQQLPLEREGRYFSNAFHTFEITARVKASNRLVQNAAQATAACAYDQVLGQMEPQSGHINFPKDRARMIEIADDFPRTFKREI